jgi:hypothetical protein
MVPPFCLVVAAFASQFPGHGGPGGNFDWVVGNPGGGRPHVLVLDTTYSVIVNETQTMTETVVRGRVDVRNMTVYENGVLVVEGPSPLFVTATGTIRIDGKIIAKGKSNLSVGTLNTTNITEPGAAGGPGGGSGGNGNPRTGESSPKGQNGFGAFAGPDLGGEGGESAYNPGFPQDSDDTHRRPAGGGGGRFGHDFLRPAGIVSGYTNPNACPDQGKVGFDAESGFSGYPGDTRFAGAIGVTTNATPPVGGRPGPGPFTDRDPANDFWGTLTTLGGNVIRGELDRTWAGAGGGGGGNAIVSNHFPTTPFDPTGDEKGAGGGGGGSGVTLFALGPIVFGTAGRIDASGGTGGGGENSLQSGDITHIGGGSGGGSGGHVVLESSSRIDFSQCSATTTPPGGVYALGGEGGAGKNDIGGARPSGIQMPPQLDALPPNSYPSATAPCGVVQGQAGYEFTNSLGDPQSYADFPYVVICAGGDGGPGIVQLHTPSPSDVIPPQNPGDSIYTIIQPPPVSSLPATGVPSYRTINDPSRWSSMFPSWGLHSRATSTWSPIVPDPHGLRLPPIRSAARPSATEPREIVIGGDAVEDLYLRYPSLLAGADLRITGDGEPRRIATATWDEDTSELRLALEASSSLLHGTDVEIEIQPRVRPGFARSIEAKLPNDLCVRVELQVAPAAADGGPDLSRAGAWGTALEARPDSGYLRVRVSVVPRETDEASVDATATPAADFLRLPLGF